MSEPKRNTSLQVTLHSLTVQPAPAGKYGLDIRGNSPPVVTDVATGSVAEHGGVIVGDYIVKINSVDVLLSSTDDVLSILNQYGGRGLTVCVARPRPVPATDVERRRALIAVQTKLDSKTIDSKLVAAEQAKYASALSGAQQAAMGVLQSLKTDEEEQQTVLLELYDSDSLASPPDSSGEEEEEEEGEGVSLRDPLLDFSRDDSLTYVPRKVTPANKEGPGDVAQSAKLSPNKPPPATLNANMTTCGSSPSKSPTKASQFFPSTSQPTSGILHPPITHTMSDKTGVSKTSSSDVIMRQRKKDGGTGALPAQPQKSPADVEVGNVASIETACRHLSNCVREWSCNDVRTWLKQLNPGLHSLYSTNFATHDVTGPSLLRLSEERLTDMGVTTQKHRYLLATSIAALRLKQESLEIKELAGSANLGEEEEELEMTYL